MGSVTQKSSSATIVWAAILVIGLLFIGWCSRSTEPTPSATAPQPETRTLPATNLPEHPTTSPASPSPGGKWIGNQVEGETIYEKGVSFQLDAESIPPGGRRPNLIVRCQDKRTDVIMVTWIPAAVERGRPGRAAIRLRFDDAPAYQGRWRESSDREALFAPDAMRLARTIAKARTLRVEFTPADATPVTLTFDISGFEQHLATLASNCGWRP